MTYEEMERAIGFLLERHARFNEDIDRIKDVQVKTTNDLQLLTGKVLQLTENITRVETEAETNRQETRDAINKP